VNGLRLEVHSKVSMTTMVPQRHSGHVFREIPVRASYRSLYPKWFEGGRELQLTGIKSLREIIEKQSTKQTRQDGDR
jgi:hypothetical protein